MATISKGENKFYVGEDIRNPQAEITFVESGENRLVIDHTYVATDLRGQGIAQQLLDHVVTYAREKGKTVVPLCPFAKGQIQKQAKYNDVLNVQHI
ncbi:MULTISPECIES: GNAT family N-acetyltransferase [Oceanobacillus]|uniref:N-acetyltransferase n=2 Tax=Oceanobacillus TaxID=182709 RepID=A0ABQ5TGE8_9BACI|nr:MULTISPECIES: GNAT family N-acetyltransferase [Oceanobacillus]MBT2601049.1 N-acetyltransferase [Oceanobacillus sp. ISL-74]MBT2653500.1 N-acetyltransferase [Oceanobacillus sp. ISL-73]MCT1578824.1 N-acetyltransferase [Oceanobacillus kimchii]MCT2137726.1 N-acetyltransferase [Oceanobacillus kimchii]OEH53278.1 acetyltransferase [Oceanobacillus sp. E9]